jgi:hypothetical protein
MKVVGEEVVRRFSIICFGKIIQKLDVLIVEKECIMLTQTMC